VPFGVLTSGGPFLISPFIFNQALLHERIHIEMLIFHSNQYFPGATYLDATTLFKTLALLDEGTGHT